MSTSKQKTVLIIDDEPDLVEILTDHLSEYNVISSSNGKAGLERALNDKPDVIISDIHMPEMDGLTMLKELKKAGSTIPVIIITAFGDKQKIKTAWDNGAFDFLDKPINYEQLKSTVRKASQFGKNFNENKNK